MRRAVLDQGASKNLALEALREAVRGPHDCGGPLDGWGLSPEDLVLFLARHRSILANVGRPPANPPKKVTLR